MLELGS